MQEPTTTILNDSLLRLEQVMQITSLCRSHVYLLMGKGEFPTSITVGVRGARWSECAVRQWVADQLAKAITTATSENAA